MQFTANQNFRFSGPYEHLEAVLKFALKTSGFKLLLKDPVNPTYLVVQNTGSMFCVGTAEIGKVNRGIKPPFGWTRLGHTRLGSHGAYDIKTLSESVIMALTEMEPANNLTIAPANDNKVLNGFLCAALSDMSAGERGRIQSPEYCIVGFKPWQYCYH